MFIDCSMFPESVTDPAFEQVRQNVDCIADDDYILTENDQTITIDGADGIAYYLKTTVQDYIRKEVYNMSERYSSGENIPITEAELENAIRKSKADAVQIVQ